MAQRSSEAKAFISYSHIDEVEVMKVVEKLSEIDDLELVIDRKDIKKGEGMLTSVSALIDKADYYLVFISENSIIAPWVKDEINMADAKAKTQRLNGFMIPIIIKKCDLPLYVKSKNYVDLTDDYDSNLELLCNQLSQDNVKKFKRDLIEEIDKSKDVYKDIPDRNINIAKNVINEITPSGINIGLQYLSGSLSGATAEPVSSEDLYRHYLGFASGNLKAYLDLYWDCPGCNGELPGRFSYCPYCGTKKP